MSGVSTVIVRSKRPGRSSALSRMSGRFVPASTTTPVVVAKPSISTSSWFSVFSRSSCPPIAPPRPRARPMASISSMKMMEGDCVRACANRSLTRAGPTPTNISMKSDPEMDRKGTPASPAVALASSVLPVPGGPTSSTPLGSLAPSRVNLAGFLRNSTTSLSSSLASSHPRTSLNDRMFFSGISSLLYSLGSIEGVPPLLAATLPPIEPAWDAAAEPEPSPPGSDTRRSACCPTRNANDRPTTASATRTSRQTTASGPASRGSAACPSPPPLTVMCSGRRALEPGAVSPASPATCA
mmetsp:Transcript_14483/g.36007  ORF Transcript_14483/g.36007 Transcript_14483/m.36007 type:complete len:297 (+) Transcript_14483:508-1398(+)